MAGSFAFTNNPSEEYDVFLSFRGEDTRKGFTSHLYAALCRRKINAFIDDQIVRGDEISSFVLNTIKASKISVIIFSKNYASSRWCLQELEQILHCMKKGKQIVIPVFYHLDPSDVRNQTGSFGDGFAELEKCTKEKLEMLQRWKTALNEAASLAGWTTNDQKSESKLIDETLDDILMRLNKLSPSDYTDLVGIEAAIKKIESLLHKGSNGVSIIGIWGIGGIGKTTIARVVFNKILSHFEGSYFVENVREESEKSSRLTHLQKEFLSTILEDGDPNIGLTFTRKRLKEKKVLIVFDDVTSLLQIENLIGNLNWMSSKSRIIITTRDKQVLRNCGVDDSYIYKVEGLREKEAHKLFNQYAFKQDCPIEDYMELSNKAIAYTKCLPLALKVLGSYLFSKGKEFWESAINKLENGPPLDIQKVLKVSYDGLEKEEKDLFLDIACFFIGEHIDTAIEVLNACDISAQQGIQVLIDKCLVSMAYGNKIAMHDLLQEMGRKIARDDTSKDIRLWHHVDIFKAFKKNKGIEAVRSINLDISKISNAGLNCRVLSKMDNLRFFRVYNSEYQDNYGTKLDGFEELESFPNDIRFFGWNNYPFKSLPLSFPSESLVKLVMQDNKVKHWNGVQNLVNLKYVDLSFSKHMTDIPNLSRASNLQKLILEGCSSLLEITPSSIQNLNKLVVLDLRDCSRLISLPDGIRSKFIDLSFCDNLKIAPKISCMVEVLLLTGTAIKESPFIEHPSKLVELDLSVCSSLVSLSSSTCKLKFLKKLNLEACSKLERLLDDFGDLEDLEILNNNDTVIKEIPLSILRQPELNTLFLSRHIDETPLNWVLNSSSGLSSLVSLYLENCQITKLPDSLGQLSFLENLYLSRNNFESIPESIKGLSKLYLLDISNCQRLQVLPELPMGVNVVASDCSSLQSISDRSFLLLPHRRIRTTEFTNCFKLDLTKILREESCREFCANICFPGNEIPKWFTFQNTRPYIALDQSLDWHNKNFLGFLSSAVICTQNFNIWQNYYATCYCLVKSEDGKEQIYRNYIGFWDDDDDCLFDRFCSDDIRSDHVLFGFHSIMKNAFEECDEEYHEISCEMKSLNCKVLIKFHAGGREVKKCGIHFLYVEDYGEPLETSRRSVDNAEKKRKEKEKEKEKEKDKDELKSSKLQISNSFDGICRLRPRFMSICPLDRKCLEARYWKLKRNALREIVKNALLNFQQNNEEMNCVNPKGCMSFPGSEILEWFNFQNASDYIELLRCRFHTEFTSLAFCTVVEFPDLLELGEPFFVKCEMHFKEDDDSYKILAVGSIQGWFEGDRTHYIKSDHVFLGYDCIMYTHEFFNVCGNDSGDKTIIRFYVTNSCGVIIEGCKVKKCGVRLLYPQDFENKWENPIKLSSLKRRLKLNGNDRCNDEPPSYGLSAARDWQSRSSAASLDLNLMVGSTVTDATEPPFKRLKICSYKDNPLKLGANGCNDESQSYGLSTTSDWQSSGFNSLDFDVNQLLQGSHESMVNGGTINKSGFRDDEQQYCGISSSLTSLNEFPQDLVQSNESTCCDDEPPSRGISTIRDRDSNSSVLLDLNQLPEDFVESMVNVAAINRSGCFDDEPSSCGLSEPRDWQFKSSAISLDLNEKVGSTVLDTIEQPSCGLSEPRAWQFKSSATSLDLDLMVGSTVIDTTEPHSKRLKICNYENKYEDGKEEVEELSPSTSQPAGFALFDLNEFPIDDEDEKKPKRLKNSNSFKG